MTLKHTVNEPGLLHDRKFNGDHNSGVGPGFSRAFNHHMKDKQKLRKLLKVEKVDIDPCAIFV